MFEVYSQWLQLRMASSPVSARTWNSCVKLPPMAPLWREPRFAGRVIQGVNPSVRTPLWMRERLRRAGLRPIRLIVDVTNYVMLELGQPLHAYDLRKLHSHIEVRLARPGERLKLLDGRELPLEAAMLVIADDRGPVGLAGVMGGEASGIAADTSDVFLEGAFFPPAAVAGVARQLGLVTDAAQRFERGVDPRGQERAIERAAQYSLAAASLKQAWQDLPDITTVSDHITVEDTEEGLNIVIADREGHPMFTEGSKYPFEQTRKAIDAMAPSLSKLPNRIRITGHTASGATYDNPRYGPWELSFDRANVARQILEEFGVSDDRIESVVGRAATEPYFPGDPYLSGNQRVAITLVYEKPPVPVDLTP